MRLETMAKLELDSDDEKLKGKAKRKAKKQEYDFLFKIDSFSLEKPISKSTLLTTDGSHYWKIQILHQTQLIRSKLKFEMLFLMFRFKATTSTKEILTARSKKRTEILESDAKAPEVKESSKKGVDDVLQLAESVSVLRNKILTRRLNEKLQRR